MNIKNEIQDEEDDDFGFGNKISVSYSKDDSFELLRLQEKINLVEEESVESTRRTLVHINQSYEAGVKTAEVFLIKQNVYFLNFN
jgi:hypothetical protein